MAKQRIWEDRWTKDKEVGAGGQGHTYLVTSKDGNARRGVLKLLNRDGSRQARRRMLQEVTSLRLVRDAGGSVPEVIEDNALRFDEKDLELYFVMQFVDGETLDELIKRTGPLSLDNSITIIRQICHTIEIGHEIEVLHRDLKPNNIIRSKEGTVFIVDFGLSFARNDNETDLTKPNEQFRNRFLNLPETQVPGGDRRNRISDVTAVCGLFYFLLTGHYPSHVRDDQDRPPHRRPGYMVRELLGSDTRLTHVESLLDKAFSRHIDHRFKSVEDLETRLKSLGDLTDATTIEDPRNVAQEVESRVLAANRKAQLQSLRPAAGKLIKAIQKQAQSYAGNLGCIHLSLTATTMAIPPRFDTLSINASIEINYENQDSRRAIVYALGAEGMQTVLLRTCGEKRESDKIINYEEEWCEVLWFEGEPSEEHCEAAIQDLVSSLNAMMRSLGEELGA